VSFKKTIVTLVASAVVASASAVPAQATAFSVSSDKSSNLVVAGDTVTVTLTGVPADTGVYVRLCKGTLAQVSAARPTVCFGQGAWVTLSANQQNFGAGNAALPVSLAVQAQFEGANCLLEACGIHVRRDHLGGSMDYSLDRFIPVTFASPVVSTPAPAVRNGVVRSPGKVTFTIVNKKGKTVTVWVGFKRFVKKIGSNNFTMTVPATSKGLFNATAYVDGKKLVEKRFSK
jgi:hypothetical protein